jgi:hypothetical protein
MQMPQMPSPRTSPGVAPRDEHRSHWKLGVFTWPIWHRRAIADSLTRDTASTSNSSPPGLTRQSVGSDGEGPPPEYFAATLSYERELHDALLGEARQRLEALEADPDTDELTLVMARHEVFRRKISIAQALRREECGAAK